MVHAGMPARGKRDAPTRAVQELRQAMVSVGFPVEIGRQTDEGLKTLFGTLRIEQRRTAGLLFLLHPRREITRRRQRPQKR